MVGDQRDWRSELTLDAGHQTHIMHLLPGWRSALAPVPLESTRDVTGMDLVSFLDSELDDWAASNLGEI